MTRLSILILLLTMSAANLAGQATPSVKKSGCSLFPDCNYGHCCVEHDKDYFNGGTSKQRRQSDHRLYRCVKNTKGWQNKFTAPVMWMGVRVFGVSFLPTPFRWGFGRVKHEPKYIFQKPVMPGASDRSNLGVDLKYLHLN